MELQVRDDEVIEHQRTINELRAERLSLQEQLAQFRQKLNQMSTTQHFNAQKTATTIRIGNFFCTTHGYFRTVVFPLRRSANARAGTKVRYHGVPTPHLCPRITDKTLPTDDDMMIPNNDDYTILRDGSSDRTSQGSTRLEVDDFKKIFKMISRSFQEFKMDQFKRRAIWPCAKDQPA